MKTVPRLKKSHEYEINGYLITVVVDAADPREYAQTHIRALMDHRCSVDNAVACAMLAVIKERLTA
jgi:hypothetical protein